MRKLAGGWFTTSTAGLSQRGNSAADRNEGHAQVYARRAYRAVETSSAASISVELGSAENEAEATARATAH
jgi:hypothetical protein